MPVCVRCPMRSSKKPKMQEELERYININFFKFPTDEARKLSWVKAMGLDGKALTKYSVLCSLHFTASDFDRTSINRLKLNNNVIPSVIDPVIHAANENINTLNILHEVPTSIASDSSVCTEFTVMNALIKTEDTDSSDDSHETLTQIASEAPSTEFIVMNPLIKTEDTERFWAI